MKTWSLLSLLCFASLASAVCTDSLTWVPGHYTRSGCGNVWVSGYYRRQVHVVRTQEVWVDGRWIQSDCGWSYEPGHWETQSVACAPPAPCVRETVIVTQPPCNTYQTYQPACHESSSRVSWGVGVSVGIPVRSHHSAVPLPLPSIRHLPPLPPLPKLPKLPKLPNPVKFIKNL